jgi:hypothetical protein
MTNNFKTDTNVQGYTAYYNTSFITPDLCELYTPATAANGDATFTKTEWVDAPRVLLTWEDQGQPDAPEPVSPINNVTVGAAGSKATLTLAAPNAGTPAPTRYSFMYSQDVKFRPGPTTRIVEGTVDVAQGRTLTTAALTKGQW